MPSACNAHDSCHGAPPHLPSLPASCSPPTLFCSFPTHRLIPPSHAAAFFFFSFALSLSLSFCLHNSSSSSFQAFSPSLSLSSHSLPLVSALLHHFLAFFSHQDWPLSGKGASSRGPATHLCAFTWAVAKKKPHFSPPFTRHPVKAGGEGWDFF